MQVIHHSFDTHAFVKAFVNAKTDEERGEILARTIVITEEKFVSAIATSEAKSTGIVEKKFENAKDELVTKQDLALSQNNLATRGDVKEVELGLRKDIEGIKKEIKELDLKIASLELRLTNKMYFVAGALAVFMTTVTLGILPFVLHVNS